MFSRIWIANLLLAMVAIFFGIKAYEVWSRGEKRPPEMRVVKRSLSPPEKRIAKREIPAQSEYEVVVRDNLFWPDRQESDQQQAAAKPDAKSQVDKRYLWRLEEEVTRIVLYGIIDTAGQKKALIANFQPQKGGRGKQPRPPMSQRPTLWVKVGDTVGEFKVKEIREASVILAGGERYWPISLYEKKKPKRRADKKKQETPTVVSVGASIKGKVKEVISKPKEDAPRPGVSKGKQSPRPVVIAGKTPSGQDSRKAEQR